MDEVDEKRAEELSPATQSLSIAGSKTLLNLLVQRGYLHSDAAPILADPNRREETTQYSTNDSACELVLLEDPDETSGAYCCTYSLLTKNLMDELHTCGGRATVRRLVAALRVKNDEPLLRILGQFDRKILFQQGDEILSSEYLDRVVKEIFDSLLSSTDDEAHGSEKPHGRSLISDLASQKLHLPMDITLKALEERLPKEGIQILQLDAGATLATDGYLTQFQADVLKYFADLKDPVTISDVDRKSVV